MYFKSYDTGNNLGKLIGKFCMHLILQIYIWVGKTNCHVFLNKLNRKSECSKKFERLGQKMQKCSDPLLEGAKLLMILFLLSPH